MKKEDEKVKEREGENKAGIDQGVKLRKVRKEK
jgi:hypothetical protein